MPAKRDFIYTVGDIVNNRIITERLEQKNKSTYRKIYTVKCLKCGATTKVEEKRLNMNCGVCSGKRVVSGINDVATLRPDLVKYFDNHLEAQKIGLHSKKSRLFRCPHCGTPKKSNMDYIVHNGFKCKVCNISNGSFGECLFAFILSKNNIKFIREYVFDWAKNYRYDFYLCDLNYIIEIQGIQHYCVDSSWNKNKTIEDLFQYDENKKNVALKNGISKYFQIDCRSSDIDFIINEIKKSLILESVNLNLDLDYSEFIQNLYVDIYDDVIKRYICGEALKDIAKLYSTSLQTLHKILQTPNAKIEIAKLEKDKNKTISEIREDIRKQRAAKGINKRHSNKDIICIETQKIYHTYADASRDTECNRVSISKCCNKIKHFTIDGKGLEKHWMFLDEYKKSTETEINSIITFKQFVNPKGIYSKEGNSNG